MEKVLSPEGCDLLFRSGRTHTAWLPKPVTDETLHQLYDLMKWAPTSMNTNPVRIVFVRTPEAKQRLLPALAPGNVDKTMSAPVVAIVGFDMKFYDFMPKLFPPNPKARESFATNPARAEATAVRNGTLQGGYFILAARAVGLDCGPMSGFDNAKVDSEFFNGKSGPLSSESIKSNFLCNLGYGDSAKLHPRNPRLDFDEACALL